jgi:hypothetical protein
MPISINPIFPVIAAQGAAPDLVLKPGTVIDAEVLKLLSDDLVRIAISGLSIEVFSEIPLQVGQALQLAVSQTPEGIRLAVVGQESGAKAAASADAVTLAPDTIVDVAASPPVAAAPPVNQRSRNELTPLERIAVAAAVESAATQQESLAPLFANLDAVAASKALPPKLQQAVMQALVQRISLDQNLSGSDVRNGLQKSGLLLEASLASEAVSSPAGIPDLKAALIVLRQTLLSSLGATRAAGSPATSAAQQHLSCRGLPALPPWMPRRERSRRSRSRRRLPRPRQLKQRLRRMLRRHQRLPHPLPKSTCRKFFYRRRVCRLRMTPWNWAALSASCSPKRLIMPGHVRRQPAPH